MARYFGKIGYITYNEEASGVDEEEVLIERNYYGDVITDRRKLESGIGLNDDVNINNRISIVADAYAYEHIFDMRYITWMGSKWKVTDVEVQRPRLNLSIGGLYNG